MDKVSLSTLALAKAYTDSQGGGGGSKNYNDLDHKPKINNVELSGNKTLLELGIPITSMAVVDDGLIFNA